MYKYTRLQFYKRRTYYEPVIYYYSQERFREGTGVQIEFRYLTKDKQISKSHPSYDRDVDRIKMIRDQIEEIIRSYVVLHRSRPTGGWIRTEFDSLNDSIPEIRNEPLEGVDSQIVPSKLTTGRSGLEPVLEERNFERQNPTENDAIGGPVRQIISGRDQVSQAMKKDIFCFWNEFMIEKEQMVRTKQSLIPYGNLRNVIKKFKAKRNYASTFAILDQQFFNDLVSYMVKEYEHGPGSRSKSSIPGIGLKNETIIKRLKNFVEYLCYCVETEQIYLNTPRIKKFVKIAKHKNSVKASGTKTKWELTLTLKELEFTINLEHYEPHFWQSLSADQKRYLDIFIFMCLQGTAPIDTKSIEEFDICDNQLIKERSKSGNEFQNELHPVSAEILKRYNYNLKFVDHSLNSELKRLFTTIFELYSVHYEQKHGAHYNLIDRQKIKKGEEVFWVVKHRALFVEAMTGRRSYITWLAEKANEPGLKMAMDAAGHVKISTTLGYVHKQQHGAGNHF
jgi:hypothetical protein